MNTYIILLNSTYGKLMVRYLLKNCDRVLTHAFIARAYLKYNYITNITCDISVDYFVIMCMIITVFLYLCNCIKTLV